MRILQLSLTFFGLAVISMLGGAVGWMPVSGLLNLADEADVATVRGATSGAGILKLDLLVTRNLKGSSAVGASLQVSLSDPNITSGSAVLVQVGGSIAAEDFLGKTGIWFLQQTSTGWTVLPLATGDISSEDLYLPVPPGALPTSFTYAPNITAQKKLVQEIGAAALDSSTSAAISRLEQRRQLIDLGSDLQGVLGQLASSPQLATSATGLAAQIRLGLPAAIITLGKIDPKAIPLAEQNRMAAAVCEYRSTDSSGIVGLGTLLSSQPTDSLKLCVTYALREIHTVDALPMLTTLLNDASPQVRYDALIGIAQFAMGFPVVSMKDKPGTLATFVPGVGTTSDMRQHFPSQGLFASDEQTYISYWKNWLASRGAQ